MVILSILKEGSYDPLMAKYFPYGAKATKPAQTNKTATTPESAVASSPKPTQAASSPKTPTPETTRAEANNSMNRSKSPSVHVDQNISLGIDNRDNVSRRSGNVSRHERSAVMPQKPHKETEISKATLISN